MLFIELTIVLSFLFLLAGSCSDLRTGEVPEKTSRGYILTMFLLAFLSSLLMSDIRPALYAILIGIAYFLFGYATYYFGQWGGGDVKILAGIGLSLGLLYGLGYNFPNSVSIPYYIGYFLDIGIVMIPYVFLYGIVLGLRDKSMFPEYAKNLRNGKFLFVFALSFVPSFLSLYLGLNLLSLVYILIPFFLLASVYLKVMEKTSLVEEIPTTHLKDGDVIAEDITIGGIRISSKNINGLEQRDVDRIKKLSVAGKFPKKVRIRYGVKSVPILMLAFLMLLLYGNFLEILLM